MAMTIGGRGSNSRAERWSDEPRSGDETRNAPPEPRPPLGWAPRERQWLVPCSADFHPFSPWARPASQMLFVIGDRIRRFSRGYILNCPSCTIQLYFDIGVTIHCIVYENTITSLHNYPDRLNNLNTSQFTCDLDSSRLRFYDAACHRIDCHIQQSKHLL